MNILIPDTWLREYIKTEASPKDIQKCLSLSGPSVEKIIEMDKELVYDIEITTNRVDCMSVMGIAREAAAILPQFGFTATLKIPTKNNITSGITPGLSIKNNPRLCHRILALKIENLKVDTSPKWLQDRLNAIGQRPLNNLVDITNYVMWETGHPTHVFDFNRLSTGKMLIREARKGESLVTFDEKSYTLAGGEVVIEDGTGKIIDLPSIMGTANSVVVPSTTAALFFIDDVESAKVRFASMTHSIRTQAAVLNEKNVDPELAPIAMSRIVSLVKTIIPQAQIGVLTDIYPSPRIPEPISLPLSLVNNRLGVAIPDQKIIHILKSLSFKVTVKKSELLVTPPSWRSQDISIAEDLIEEIARIYGYHNIPSGLMAGNLPANVFSPQFDLEFRLKNTLKYLGFTEVYTYSLVDDDSGLRLKNPLSLDWAFLRTSLTPSHLKIIAQNQGKSDQLNFFEIAHVYLPKPKDLPREELRLVVSTTNPDYYRFKGIIETLFSDIGLPLISPDLKSYAGILVFEIPLAPLFSQPPHVKTYIPISKFSPIIEDVNLNLSEKYARIENKIRNISNLIKQIDVIDRYGPKITLRITYHSDQKQLSDTDIAPIREKLSAISRGV